MNKYYPYVSYDGYIPYQYKPYHNLFYSVIIKAPSASIAEELKNAAFVCTERYTTKDVWMTNSPLYVEKGTANSLEQILDDDFLKYLLGLDGGRRGKVHSGKYLYNTLLITPTNYKIIKRQIGFVVTIDTKESIERFFRMN